MKLLFSICLAFLVAAPALYSKPSADLTPPGSLTVYVQTPDGKPVKNATVVCVDAATRGVLTGTTIKGGSERFQTDSSGRFTFSLQKPDLAFMLVTDDGFGMGQIRDITNNPVIIVRPWGHLEGTRTNRSRPVTGQTIALAFDQICLDDPDHEIVDDQAVTDSQGHFNFDHVPYANLTLLEPSLSGDQANVVQRLVVNPDEHKSIQIATDGRTIAGRLEFDQQLPLAPGPIGCLVSLASLAGHHVLLSPISPDFDTPEKRIPWWQQTFQSAASAQMEGFLPPDQNGSDFGIQPDGSLASEFKVAPGTYWVSGMLVQNKKKIARVNQFIDIPADKPGDTNEIFDVGNIQALPLLAEGSPAPDFDVASLGGKRFKLSDFHGKYVLLDFWATWCVPCLFEIPNLIDTYDTYGKDSRLVMISLNLDDDSDAPRKFVERHDMGWTQGWLGDWDQDKVTKEYEVQAIPSIWLIGPDGKIIAIDLRGPAIKDAVAAALKSK